MNPNTGTLGSSLAVAAAAAAQQPLMNQLQAQMRNTTNTLAARQLSPNSATAAAAHQAMLIGTNPHAHHLHHHAQLHPHNNPHNFNNPHHQQQQQALNSLHNQTNPNAAANILSAHFRNNLKSSTNTSGTSGVGGTSTTSSGGASSGQINMSLNQNHSNQSVNQNLPLIHHQQLMNQMQQPSVQQSQLNHKNLLISKPAELQTVKIPYSNSNNVSGSSSGSSNTRTNNSNSNNNSNKSSFNVLLNTTSDMNSSNDLSSILQWNSSNAQLSFSTMAHQFP
jgi:hypothetical protein